MKKVKTRSIISVLLLSLPFVFLCCTSFVLGTNRLRREMAVAEENSISTFANESFGIKILASPNDPKYKHGDQWGLNKIHAPEAWDITTGSNTVLVGIMDSGIDASHPDLTDNIYRGNPHNISTTLHRDFSDPNEPYGKPVLEPTDVSYIGHGSHVAGIVGACGNNDIGITGVAWNVKLVSLKVFNHNGLSDDDIRPMIRAIRYAQKIGLHILNFSGCANSDDPNNMSEFEKAIQDFDGLFITAAGNFGSNIDDALNPVYPASFTYDNILAVGNTDANDARASNSCYGEESVDIYAPGTDIKSTMLGSYDLKSGTSMATPHVTGVAALLLSGDSTLTTAELKEAIINGGDNITINTPKGDQTVKRLNALKAIEYLKLPLRMLYSGGGGTSDNPFLISTAEQFYDIRLAHRSVYLSGSVEQQIDYCFKLMNNITLSGDWTPFEYKFSGLFDGNNKSIEYALTLTQSDLNASNYQGLFGYVTSGARIRNLNLNNCSITNSGSISGVSYVCTGILAGRISSASEIRNVTINNATINCNTEGAYIGGICGTTSSTTFTNCNVLNCDITSYNGSLGGMAGEGSVSSFSKGTVSGTLTKNKYSDSDLVGPVVGNSTSSGSVTTTGLKINKNKECIAAGTLITLANGDMVPVETLTGNEMLLVWNLKTGSFDSAPILFVDVDSAQEYEIVNLSFSDGTSVKVISEHGFWDFDLNKYVYLDRNAAQYLGHFFNKQTTDENGDMVWSKVQLVSVELTTEYTAAYSPVTYSHLCYYVNGMLSMPGGIDGLFNIFEADGETMKYDESKMQADIEKYGLFTYEEFVELVPVTEEVFNAFNGEYLKVAIGKGLISVSDLNALATRYARFF